MNNTWLCKSCEYYGGFEYCEYHGQDTREIDGDAEDCDARTPKSN
jgi:hypothetical protein